MRKTSAETAILIAIISKRSGQSRIRISGKTLRFVSGRTTLRSAFLVEVIDKLADMSLTMSELDNGSFGIIETKILEGAKSFTARKMFNEAEIKKIKKNSIDFAPLETELELGGIEDAEDME